MEDIIATENGNQSIVVALYEALATGDSETVVGLLAPDLEWWFHGPPRCHYMMRMLTGEVAHNDFRFEPRSVTALGNRVVAEGWEGEKVYWVHVWTVNGGVITQFREYFNTVLTVRELGRPAAVARREETRKLRQPRAGPTVWQSEAGVDLSRSMPGLVLAL